MTVRSVVLALALALALAVAPAGCTAPPPGVKRPVALQGTVSARRASFGGVAVRASIGVSNPNTFPIELQAIDWELSIDGTQPVRERSMVRRVVAANSETRTEFGMRIPPAAGVRMGTRLAVGARGYRISGILHFDGPRGPIAVSFEQTGELE